LSALNDIDGFLALDRVTDMVLSPDGTRLVVTVSRAAGSKMLGSLWEVDPLGVAPPARLTYSALGEESPRFMADGSLLFTSCREADDDVEGLWLLPSGPGEARQILTRAGGFADLATAANADVIVFATPLLPGSADISDDERRRKLRAKTGVSAILHTISPVRDWNRDLGLDEVRLQLMRGVNSDTSALTDLTPSPGRALQASSLGQLQFDITPDGRSLVTTWQVIPAPGIPVTRLVCIDTTSGERRDLTADEDVNFGAPTISPDGRWVAATREELATIETPPRFSLYLADLTTGEGYELRTNPEPWEAEVQFSADSNEIYFTTDQDGHRPVFKLTIDTQEVRRVTDEGVYSALQVAPDGTVFALRSHVDHPPTPVRLDGEGVPLIIPAPGAVDVPGRLERVRSCSADGVTVSGWLALPEGGDTPAPLLLWIHGGPLHSWAGWNWRWNPWLMVAKGYAVLMPDPALSTGYGQEMIGRGWGQWGGAPFTDLMRITEEIASRPDIDQERMAAMGSSYGGYMANWMASHTDRFRCFVTHAGLWSLDQVPGTTDYPGYWAREWGEPADRPEQYARWSPHHHVRAIKTPVLVVHGGKDYRSPISEGIRLWTDLQTAGVESKFLYFPDEGHWVLKPGNVRIWYETVWAWLAKHLLQMPWQQPELM